MITSVIIITKLFRRLQDISHSAFHLFYSHKDKGLRVHHYSMFHDWGGGGGAGGRVGLIVVQHSNRFTTLALL